MTRARLRPGESNNFCSLKTLEKRRRGCMCYYASWSWGWCVWCRVVLWWPCWCCGGAVGCACPWYLRASCCLRRLYVPAVCLISPCQQSYLCTLRASSTVIPPCQICRHSFVPALCLLPRTGTLPHLPVISTVTPTSRIQVNPRRTPWRTITPPGRQVIRETNTKVKTLTEEGGPSLGPSRASGITVVDPCSTKLFQVVSH